MKLNSMQQAAVDRARERLAESQNSVTRTEAAALQHWGALEYHCEQLLKIIAAPAATSETDKFMAEMARTALASWEEWLDPQSKDYHRAYPRQLSGLVTCTQHLLQELEARDA